jgi:ethanolamine-phosphate phospho-lyase
VHKTGVMEEENLQQNAYEVGKYYKKLMRELTNDFKCIGDVRGSGLFLGFEILNDDDKPDTQLAKQIKNTLRDRHILISTDGPYDSVLKSKPPLCFNKNNAEEVVDNIWKILKNY